MQVCPDCGCREFTAEHPAVVRRTYRVDERGYADDVSEEVIDIDRDFDTLKCEDCGCEHDLEDLISDEAYNGCDYDD